ncbi:hypothetical protein LXL04_037422 [Taraxacum kok-saghyz]
MTVLKPFVVFFGFLICQIDYIYGHKLVEKETASSTLGEGISNIGCVPTKGISCRDANELYGMGHVGFHFGGELVGGDGSRCLDDSTRDALIGILYGFQGINGGLQAITHTVSRLRRVIEASILVPG